MAGANTFLDLPSDDDVYHRGIDLNSHLLRVDEYEPSLPPDFAPSDQTRGLSISQTPTQILPIHDQLNGNWEYELQASEALNGILDQESASASEQINTYADQPMHIDQGLDGVSDDSFTPSAYSPLTPPGMPNNGFHHMAYSKRLGPPLANFTPTQLSLASYPQIPDYSSPTGLAEWRLNSNGLLSTPEAHFSEILAVPEPRALPRRIQNPLKPSPKPTNSRPKSKGTAKVSKKPKKSPQTQSQQAGKPVRISMYTREEQRAIILELHLNGMKDPDYKKLEAATDWVLSPEALRGDWRHVTVPADERLRDPPWDAKAVRCLVKAVEHFVPENLLRAARQRNTSAPRADLMKKVPWQKIGPHMQKTWGTYKYSKVVAPRMYRIVVNKLIETGTDGDLSLEDMEVVLEEYAAEKAERSKKGDQTGKSCRRATLAPR